MIHRRLAKIAVVALAVTVAACGSDDDDTGSSAVAATSPATAATTAPAATDAPEATDAPDTAASAPDTSPESSAPADTTAATDAPASTDAPDPTDPPVDTSNYDLDAELDFTYHLFSKSLDPHMEADQGGRMGWLPAYDTLWLSVDFRPEPNLVTETEISDDGLVWTLQLRDDVLFGDGSKFNAEAVKANIERVKAEGADALAASLGVIESVNVLDEFSVEFVLSEPRPELQGSLAGAAGAMINPVAFSDSAQIANQTFGSGPYQSIEFIPETLVRYERNPAGYWKPGAANLAKLNIHFVADTQTAFNGLQSGDYDQIWATAPDDQLQQLVDDGFALYRYPSSGPDAIAFRNTHGMLGDKKVRQAMAHAIDRAAIGMAVYGPSCTPVTVPVPPGTPLYSDYNPYPFDMDKARALLEEAGAIGAKLEIVPSGTTATNNVAAILQQSFSEIGMDARLVPAPTGAGGLFGDGQFDSYVTAYVQQDHVLQYLDRYWVEGGRFQLLVGEPEHEELAAMMAEARDPATPADDLADLYVEMGKVITDTALIVPICNTQYATLADPKVLNLENARRWSLPDFTYVAVAKD